MCSALARTGSGHNLPKKHSRGPPDARLEQSCGQFRSFGWARQLCLMENGDCREAIVQWSSTGSKRKLIIILANHKYRTLSVQFLAGRRGLAAAGTYQRCLMPYKFRQWRNQALASDAILQVIPEVDPQLPAGFLQARKRVSATPSRVTAGTATDFPFLHVVA